jgi:hypothetical protein
VAVGGGGESIVVWQSWGSSGSDTASRSVQLRRFAASGEPLDSQDVQVNVFTSSEQQRPALAVGPEGDFVVAWESYGSFGTDDSGRSIQVRRFRADGTPLDPQELQVNTIVDGFQEAPRVAIDPRGNFVVVWQGDASPVGRFGWDIWGRRFRADGTPLDSAEFQVNTFTTAYQYQPAIAMDARGNFVVAWDSEESAGTDHDDLSVQARRYRADGTPLDAAEFQVNTYTTHFQYWPDVGMSAEGDFTVVWTSAGSFGTDDGPTTSIQGRRFLASGSPLDANDVQLNALTSEYQQRSSVSVAPDGDFSVVWGSTVSAGNDSSDFSVQARRFGRPTIEVTSVLEGRSDALCTLHDAIEAAKASAPVGGCRAGDGGAVIELPPESLLSLSVPDNGSNALPIVDRPITLRGRGAMIARDLALACPVGPEFRLLEVAEGGVLTLEDVHLTNGCISTGVGGGVLVSGGTLILHEATVAGNEAGGGGGGVAVAGGGVGGVESTLRGNYSTGPGGGMLLSGEVDTLLVDRSTLSGNVADRGGGISLAANGNLLVRNSTLSGNDALSGGGGLEVTHVEGQAVLEFSTIADNGAPSGAGLRAEAGAIWLHGDLMGGSRGGLDCAAGAGSLGASGLSLDVDGSCAALAGIGVTTVPSLELGFLEANGGAARTHLPSAGSPALEAAPECSTRSGAPVVRDERGYLRPTDDDGDGVAACDLGAVERGSVFLDGFETANLRRWSATSP